MESAQLFNLIKNSIHRISKDWNWESVAKDLNIGRPAEQCQARWNRAGVVVRNSIRKFSLCLSLIVEIKGKLTKFCE